MSKPRYRWWGYVRRVVRDYQKLMAANSLTVDDRKDRDAVTRAIDQTSQQPNGENRLSLIKGVYWGSVEQCIEDVAFQLYISNETAKRWHGEFIRLVADGLGFDTNKPPAKRGPRPKKPKKPSE